MWLYLVLTVYVIIFPFSLGYSVYGIMSNRVGFFVCAVIGTGAVLCSLYTAMWLHGKVSMNNRLIVICSVVLSVLGLVISRPSDWMMVKQVIEFTDGTMENFYSDSKKICEYIQDSDDDNVIITWDIPESEIIGKFDVSKKTEFWTNNAIVEFYGKKTI